MTTIYSVILVDKRIQGHETIVDAIKPDDVRCIVFDVSVIDAQYDGEESTASSFAYILDEIAALGVGSFTNIGIVQHNRTEPFHRFFSESHWEVSTVADVETADPTLQTWSGFAAFVTTLKNTYGVQNVDLMACALYSDPNWKYVIDTLDVQTGVTIRASTDDTGAAALGGDWFLESHTGVNLKDVYFTEAIENVTVKLVSKIASTLGALTIPAKMPGDPPFVLTAPTSTVSSIISPTHTITSRTSVIIPPPDIRDISYGTTWLQRGQDIDGEAAGDFSGTSVSMSADGRTLAIGALYNDGTGATTDNRGHVRVYDLSGNTWVQRGDDIDGEAAGDESGSKHGVSLSANGSVVAIAARRNNGNGAASGHVRVYAWNGISWAKRGDDIDGEAANDYSGESVSISADGTVVAIGATDNDGSGNLLPESGHVRVRAWNGISWVPRGNDIDGEAANDWSGRSVSISADGNVVAIGAILNDGTTGNTSDNRGHVRVYAWNGISWNKRGDDIDGEASGDYSGVSVSISSDGSIVAIGATANDGSGNLLPNSGHVRVRAWNGISWVPRGDDIDGEATGDESGISVSISADGSILAIGAYYNDGTVANSDRGHVRVYAWNGISWVKRGQDIDGETASDQSGFSVSLSADGTRVAIGAQYNDGTVANSNRGHVRVYEISVNNALTYSSSNSSVADVCGNILLIKGVNGTSTITASQTGNTVTGRLDVSGTTYTLQYNPFTYTMSDASLATVSTYGTVTLTGAVGTSTITATQPETLSYASRSVTGTLDVSGIVTVLGALTIPSKMLGDASFSITPPTSNNPSGAFTYTSSNTGVATVTSVGVVTIIGIGTTTITATQARSGIYSSASVTGSFVVNFGNTTAISRLPTDGASVIPTPVSNVTTTYGSLWNQLGADIVGGVAGDESGTSVSVSADGTIVAIGARSNSTNRGTVRVYKYNNVSWVQMGTDINGEASSDYSGQSVSLSANGRILAIGANMNDTIPNTDALYFFSSFTFDNAGASGRNGPTLSACRTRYLATAPTATWAQDTTNKYLDMSTNGIQLWTVPATGSYTIRAVGAGGGNPKLYNRGRDVSLSTTLTKGEVIKILVGQKGTKIPSTGVGSGGGGTFVVRDVSNTIIVAGGGGGLGREYEPPNITEERITSSANFNTSGHNAGDINYGQAFFTLGGTNGNGGSEHPFSSGGGGLIGNGFSSYNTYIGGTSFINGGSGGYNVGSGGYNVAITMFDGGFGGGGGIEGGAGGGGGGGYSGGAAGVSGYNYNSGGGGGSFPPTATDNGATNTGDGFVTITPNFAMPGDSGHVRIYEFNGTNWVQRGGDIDGEANDDQSGISVSLSADGSTVAIGAIMNDGSGNVLSNSGHVRVYRYNASKTIPQLTNQNLSTFGPAGWDRLGGDIDGEAVNDQSGFSVSLSVDGSIVAIGAIFNDGTSGTVDTSNNRGHIRVYRYNASKTSPQLTNQTLSTFGPAGWDRLGADIDGEAAADQSGFSVSLSADGTTVAIGSPLFDASGSNSGRVRVFAWNGSSWTQRGQNINGITLNENVGDSVSLSADGSILSVASFMKVVSYNYNSSTNTWNQIGANVTGASSAPPSSNITNALSYSPHVYLDATNSSSYNSSTGTWTNIGSLGGSITNVGALNGFNLTNLYTNLSPYLSEFKNESFYEYTLDGDFFSISDGGGDMYDGGNFTQVSVDGVLSSNLWYNQVSTPSTITVNGKSVQIISLGYSRPLIMLALCSQRATIGMSKSGNLGADGAGSYTTHTVYSGSTINNLTVYAWARIVYNAGDPSIGDLHFVIGDSASTFFSTTMNTYSVPGTGTGESYMTMDCQNAVVGTILLSKPSGSFITLSECQTVISNLTNRFKTLTYDPNDNGGSFIFNGSNFTQIAVPSTTLTSVTYMAVVKTTGSNTGYASIIDFGNDAVLFCTSNNVLYMYNPSFSSGFTLTPGVWYVVAATITTSGTITFYVNGVSVYTATGATINRTNSVYGIGSGIPGPNESWNGKISAIAIYHNRVLTSSEITNVSNTFQTYRVSLSSQGNILAIGAREYDGASGSTTNIGLTRVYHIDTSGNYTYSSNNSAVADVCGNIILPKSIGSTTIAFTQSASGATASRSGTIAFAVSAITPTFGAFSIPAKNFGDASFNLTAPTSDSSGAFTYTSDSSNVAIVTSAGVVTIVGVGSTTITATQSASADGNYATRTISAVLVVSASLSNFNVPAKTYGDASFNLVDPTSTDNTVGFTFASSNPSVAALSGNDGRIVTIMGVGSTVITASQAATASRSQLDISATLVVSPARPIITIAPITKTYGNASFRPVITSTNTDTSGGLVFTFTSNNIAVVSMLDASLVRINGVGTTTLSIIQAASANFTDASSSVVITVNKGTSGFSASSFVVAANKTYGDASFAITTAPISSSTGAITYLSSDENVATITSNGSGNAITLVGQGTVTFTASQAESALYTADTKTSNTLTVARKTAALSRNTPSAATITKYYGDASFSVSATNESNGVFSFLSSDPSFATIDASTGVVSIVAVGSTTLTATRAQTAQYNEASISWTLNIARGTTTLTGLSSLTRNVTVAPFTVTATSASDGAVSYSLQDPSSTVVTVHPTSGLVTLLSPGSAVIVASQAQGTLYEAPSSITATITVTAAATTLQGATLTGTTTFANVDLSGASLTNANITNTNFASGRLNNSNFSGATISGANMSSAELSTASLANATVTNTNFSSGRLNNANLNGASISNSNMTSADLLGATMRGATITGTNFTSAILRRTDLSGANVRSSIFNSADLSGSSLARLDASGASFVNANLSGANLSNADFTNADMTKTNISGADITNVTFTVPQKLQLLKNTNNRPISDIQVTQVSGNVLLSVLSAGSAVRDVPSVTNAVFKVMLPTTSLVASETVPDIDLDIANFANFYLPIDENEYFQIQGVKYYVTGSTVRNYATGAAVETIGYGVKAIRLLAGSLTIIVNSQNTLSSSSFVVPSYKINTDAAFSPITLPTSNSSAPIVYSSSNTNIATINSSTGAITPVAGACGFVKFTASQVATETHEAASITSNELFVNRLIDLSLPGLNQTFSLSTLAALDASSVGIGSTDATAIFYVRLSDMTNLFQYQSDSFDVNNTDASDIKYYVFHRTMPTELHINPSHAMMNKTESTGMLGSGQGYAADKSLVKHDFIRYIALRLFNTYHGVDLFRNEQELQENIAYLGETVQNNINTILSEISTTSANQTMASDASGNKYLTNDASGNTNLSRELMRQIAAAEPSRFYNNGDSNSPGIRNMPLHENDSINFKLTITAAPDQNIVTGVTIIPSRTYLIKMILKNTVNTISNNTNTVISDSEMYPNSYPYSASVITYPPTAESSSVYNVYSPPAPIPSSRFGYNGWYYANTTTWVNIAPSVRDRVKWVIPPNAAGSSTVADFRYIRMNLKIFNKTSIPFLVVTTQAGSSRKYTISAPNSLTNGTVYSFYMNFNSYAREPATVGATNAALTYSNVGNGSFADGEVITSIAFETDSAASAGTVEFTLSSMVVGEASGEKEYGFSANV